MCVSYFICNSSFKEIALRLLTLHVACPVLRCKLVALVVVRNSRILVNKFLLAHHYINCILFTCLVAP